MHFLFRRDKIRKIKWYPITFAGLRETAMPWASCGPNVQVKEDENMRRKILALILIVLLCFIWGHSAVPALPSGKESNRVYYAVEPVLKQTEMTKIVTAQSIRRWAHVAEYAALGIILQMLCGFGGKGLLYTFDYGILVAFVDETIQIFSGRGSKIADLWLDLSGVAIGAALAWLGWLIFAAKKTCRGERR